MILKSIGYVGALLLLTSHPAFASRSRQAIDEASEVNDYLVRAIQQAPIHKDITTTVFWVGERAKPNSGWSDNIDSAWDMRWKENFGGLDSPRYRKGFFPAKFRPKQNPFYVALPFNDVSNPEYLEVCPILKYFKFKKAARTNSVCKNRWIEIIYNGKSCFGQWQDVGPFYTNDYDYVFRGQTPKAHGQDLAGLDVSPAIRDYLNLKFNGVCRSTWRFVDDAEVSEGPWMEVITKS